MVGGGLIHIIFKPRFYLFRTFFSGAIPLNLSVDGLKRSGSTQSLQTMACLSLVTPKKFVRAHTRSRSDDTGLLNNAALRANAQCLSESTLASGIYCKAI